MYKYMYRHRLYLIDTFFPVCVPIDFIKLCCIIPFASQAKKNQCGMGFGRSFFVVMYLMIYHIVYFCSSISAIKNISAIYVI